MSNQHLITFILLFNIHQEKFCLWFIDSFRFYRIAHRTCDFQGSWRWRIYLVIKGVSCCFSYNSVIWIPFKIIFIFFYKLKRNFSKNKLKIPPDKCKIFRISTFHLTFQFNKFIKITVRMLNHMVIYFRWIF